MKKKKYSSPKLYEYRIRFNAEEEHSASDSYHYFQAESAAQALGFHEAMMKKKSLKGQTISVEKKDPYRLSAGIPQKWENKSDILLNNNND